MGTYQDQNEEVKYLLLSPPFTILSNLNVFQLFFVQRARHRRSLDGTSLWKGSQEVSSPRQSDPGHPGQVQVQVIPDVILIKSLRLGKVTLIAMELVHTMILTTIILNRTRK